jgi:hypothetical protein
MQGDQQGRPIRQLVVTLSSKLVLAVRTQLQKHLRTAGLLAGAQV